MSSRRASERGAALVEFALVLPLIMALILGLLTGGSAYNRKLSMTNAVREGSRFGATLDGSSTWASSVQTRTVELATGDLSTSQVCVQLVQNGSVVIQGGNTYQALGANCSSIAAPTVTASSSDCVVKVWAARVNQDKLQVIFFSSNLTLTSKSVARYEGTVTSTCNV
jgi:Flp pilus assembly protein TadG